MRAHQVMTRKLITVDADTTVYDAAMLMLQKHVSGLPVVDRNGKPIGIISQGDFIRRSEIGTQRKRGRWLKFLLGPGVSARDFTHAHGRKVGEVMTEDLCTVTEGTPLEDAVRLMERRNVKRLPVMRVDALVGILTRSDLLRAVASLARDVPDPTADDDHICRHVIAAIQKNEWAPMQLGVIDRDGIAHISGIISDEDFRQAIIVAAENVPGVRLVHDHLSWFDAMSGISFRSPEDEEWAKVG